MNSTVGLKSKKSFNLNKQEDIVEFKKLPNLSTIYDLSVNIFVDDIDMTVENMYDSNFDPHWLTDHYLKNIAKYLGLNIRIIRFNLYDTNGRLIKTFNEYY